MKVSSQFVLLALFLLLLPLEKTLSNNFCYPNNVCNSYAAYFDTFSDECYCDNLADQPPIDVSEALTGNSEFYEVETADGYILGIFRFPRSNPKAVVLLQHPMTVSSNIHSDGSNISNAYWFWSQGYDVWLPNFRGTRYSRKHATLSPNSEQYWNFSFHEIGLYDHKPIIDFIYAKTAKKIFYVGHSMSTTTILIYASFYPQEAEEKLDTVFAMSPITSLKYIRSPIKYFAWTWRPVWDITKLLGWYSVLNYNAWYVRLISGFLLVNPAKIILPLVLSLIGGWTPNEMDVRLQDVAVIGGVDACSWKTMAHYGQYGFARNNNFSYFDYGRNGNIKLYGTANPPVYQVQKITLPIYLMVSHQDTIATVKDSAVIASKLQNSETYYISGFNHFDMQIGKDRYAVLFSNITDVIDKKINNTFKL